MWSLLLLVVASLVVCVRLHVQRPDVYYCTGGLYFVFSTEFFIFIFFTEKCSTPFVCTASVNFACTARTLLHVCLFCEAYQ